MTEQNEIIEQISNKKKCCHIPTLLLAILALLVAVFAVLQLRFSERDFSIDANRANRTLVQLKKQAQDTQQNITQLQKTTATLENQLEQQLALQPANADQKAWVLAEAVYLLQLAQYHLTFTQNIATIITLLQTVDQRLATVSDPNLDRIRILLAEALARLQAVPKVDVAGLLANINALQIQATQLPLLVPITSAEHKNNLQTQPATQSNWRIALNKSWETIQKLVVIQRHDQPITPLLPQAQQVYLQQNLQLLLQQAQWAVLQRQGVVYRSSLQQAQAWVKLYFVNNAVTTQAMLQAIQELQKIDVQPVLPDVSNVLQALQQVIASETKSKIMESKSS